MGGFLSVLKRTGGIIISCVAALFTLCLVFMISTGLSSVSVDDILLGYSSADKILHFFGEEVYLSQGAAKVIDALIAYPAKSASFCMQFLPPTVRELIYNVIESIMELI